MVAGIVVGVGVLLVGLAIFFVWQKGRSKRAPRGPRERSENILFKGPTIPKNRDPWDEPDAEELDLPLIDLNTLAIATAKFSDANKLGQGGFGTVYKGMLGGQDIAVKRLSNDAGQGMNEFKNEVKLIARLQHRNLVRLLGCCIEAEEKMLIYEYMEYGSLD